MFDLTQILLTIVIVVLTVVLTAIGIQFFLLLKDIRHTMSKINAVLDQTESLVDKIAHPTESLGNLLTGLKEGARLIETITNFFARRQEPEPPAYEEI